MVQKMGGKAVEMISDSRLVVGQVKGELEARDARMQEYLSRVKRLQLGFDLFSLRQRICDPGPLYIRAQGPRREETLLRTCNESPNGLEM